MTPLNLKKYYSRFLKGHEGKLHFAAHSHHFWPDVSREAHLEYWDDCARMSDEKWGKLFSTVIPKAQQHIAGILKLKDHEQIALAPNTHELLTRLLSQFLGKSDLRILTTGSEFHSWKRQLLRLMELPQIKAQIIPTDNLLKDRRSFIETLKTALSHAPDLFFISQVFFDSGIALTDEELLELHNAKSPTTVMVVDGYHGFAAIPTNLEQLEGKIFYLGGGYKYAQAGEGVGFMVLPKGDWRPAYTGWFAEYAQLSKPRGAHVGYSQDFMAFMGATQDFSGLYRFNSVWDLFKGLGLDSKNIHDLIKNQQLSLIKHLPKDLLEKWELTPLFDSKLPWHGHFLTFDAPNIEKGEAFELAIKDLGIVIDRRGTRIRFGFGLYQDVSDINELCHRLKKLL